MPPLAVEGAEAVAQHHPFEHHAVFVLLVRDPAVIRVRDPAEQIEGAAHVQLPAGLHVQQRQVDRAAAAVAGLLGDIALGKERLLFQLRVEIGLHTDILILDAPEDEVPDRAGRPVGVEDLQPIALHDQLAAHGLERTRRLDGQQRAGLLIAVDALADEVVGGVIADLLHDLRHIVREQHKARGVHGRIVPVFRSHALSPSRSGGSSWMS